jgi:hypothetical protein
VEFHHKSKNIWRSQRKQQYFVALMIIQDGANYQKVPAEKKRLEI